MTDKPLFKSFALISIFLFQSLIIFAGEYHTGSTLVCKDCHSIHSSAGHGYGGTSGGYSNTASGFLLKSNGDVNKLCLSCHDGDSSAPDVLESNSDVEERSAGALNDSSSSGAYSPQNGHTLGATSRAPGGRWIPAGSSGLKCTDCHHQHGYVPDGSKDISGNTVNGTYRNLKVNPGNASQSIAVSYAAGSNDSTRDVFIQDAQSYSIDNTQLNEPSSDDSGIATWCNGCHAELHGQIGGSEIGGSKSQGGFIRHPSAGTDIGGIGGEHSSLERFNSLTYTTRVMDPDGIWSPGSYDGNETPTCLTCHRAHGSEKPFGLIYMTGNSSATESGDGVEVYDLCRQCHVQAL